MAFFQFLISFIWQYVKIRTHRAHFFFFFSQFRCGSCVLLLFSFLMLRHRSLNVLFKKNSKGLSGKSITERESIGLVKCGDDNGAMGDSEKFLISKWYKEIVFSAVDMCYINIHKHLRKVDRKKCEKQFGAQLEMVKISFICPIHASFWETFSVVSKCVFWSWRVHHFSTNVNYFINAYEYIHHSQVCSNCCVHTNTINNNK